MFVHVHLYTLNMWLIMLACYSNVESVLLAAFLSPAMLNPSRNKTSTRLKVLEAF